MSQEHKTQLEKLVRERLDSLNLTVVGFSQKLAEAKGKAWYKGLNGVVYNILSGKKGIPTDEIGLWAKILRWKAGTPEYHAFYDAAASVRVQTATVGEGGKAGAYVVSKAARLEAENAQLRARVAELEAELARKR